MGNSSTTQRTITLHCYAPPYQQCHKFDLDGKKEVVDMRVVNQIPLTQGLSPSAYLPSVESLVSALNEDFNTQEIPEKDSLLSILNGFQFNCK